MDTPIATALLSGAVSLVVATLASLSAERKVRRDFKLDFAAERVVRQILKHPEWKWRSFEMVKHTIGGFTDDELRRILVRAGAVRGVSMQNAEVWGLVERVNVPERRSDRQVHGTYEVESVPDMGLAMSPYSIDIGIPDMRRSGQHRMSAKLNRTIRALRAIWT